MSSAISASAINVIVGCWHQTGGTFGKKSRGKVRVSGNMKSCSVIRMIFENK
jgi:hypothetical protein